MKCAKTKTGEGRGERRFSVGIDWVRLMGAPRAPHRTHNKTTTRDIEMHRQRNVLAEKARIKANLTYAALGKVERGGRSDQDRQERKSNQSTESLRFSPRGRGSSIFLNLTPRGGNPCAPFFLRTTNCVPRGGTLWQAFVVHAPKHTQGGPNRVYVAHTLSLDTSQLWMPTSPLLCL